MRWEPGARTEFERSQDGRFANVQVRFLTFVVIPEKTAQVAAVTTGTIQITDDPPMKAFAADLKQKGVTLVESPGGVVFVGFNLKDKAVADARVRRALSLAIDRQRLIEQVPMTVTTAAFIVGPEVPSSPKVTEQAKPDPALAKKLLAEVSMRSLQFEASVRADWVPVAEQVADQWKEVGVIMKMRVLEGSTFNQALEKKEFGAAYFAPAPWAADPDGILYPFLHSKGRYSAVQSEDIDKAIDEARAQRDPTRRLQLYTRLAEELRKDPRVIPLLHVRSVYGVRQGLQWRPRPDGWLLGSEIRITK